MILPERILQYSRLGSGHPLIILHGLYGSGDNWLSIARQLSGEYEVFLVDQRNHGMSFHSEIHDYPSMADDLARLMDHLELDRAILLGHSMGGKTAMRFTERHPGRTSRLIVADMSPRTYEDPVSSTGQHSFHRQVLTTLMQINLQGLTSLGEADRALATGLPDKRLRQFILKNLGRSAEGHYFWKLNAPALLANLEALNAGMEDVVQSGVSFSGLPALFLKGELSDYIRESDSLVIRTLYPEAQIVSLKNAGHWLHAEQPADFILVVKRFLTNSTVP